MVKERLVKVSALASGVAPLFLPVVAHANEGGSSSSSTTNQELINSLVQGFTTTTNDALSGISKIAPIALPIIGAVVVITLGIHIFKRVSKG